MAIDTRAKRLSAMLDGWLEPDGDINNQADRGSQLAFYSGIPYSTPAIPPGADNIYAGWHPPLPTGGTKSTGQV